MKWIHWSGIVLGLWDLMSPWILGFASVTPALWSGIASGILTILLVLWLAFGENKKLL